MKWHTIIRLLSLFALTIWLLATKVAFSSEQTLSNLSAGKQSQDVIYAISWKPDGTQLAAGNYYGGVRIYSSQMNVINSIPVGDVADLAWSPDGTKLAIGVYETDTSIEVQIWNMTTITHMTTIPGQSADLIKLAWSPDSTKLAITMIGIEIWDTSNTTLLDTLISDGKGADTVAWSPDRCCIIGTEYPASETADKRIVLWGAASGNVLLTLPDPGLLTTVAWSPDSTKFAVSSDGNVQIRDAQTGQILSTLQGDGKASADIDWKGNTIATTNYIGDGTSLIYAWDATTGQLLNMIHSPELIFALALSPDGTRLVYGGNGGTLQNVPASGATVCTPTQTIAAGDIAGLITAINSANSNPDADVIGLATGTYTFTSINNNRNALPRITTDITICSTDGATLTRSPSAPQFRFFEVRSTGMLTLENLTFTNGSLGVDYDGGAIFNLGTLTVNTVTFSNNQAGVGGAIASEGGQVTVTDSTFTNNTSTGDGGAIHSEADLLIETSTFAGNTADDAGAVNNDGGNLTVTDSTFSDNSADDGGAIYNDAGTLTLSGSTFTDNTGDAGGALDNLDGQAQIDNSTFTGNSASDGGAIRNYGGTITLTTSRFTGNMATDDGGALNNSGGTLTITDTRLENNTTTTRGGAIYSNSSGTMSAHNSCISGNSATAVYAASTGLQDFTGNWWGSATGPGGAGPGSGDTINSKINHANFLTAGCSLP